MNLTLEAMEKLGCLVPRNPASQAVKVILKLRKLRKNKNVLELDQVLGLPLMSDPTMIEIMKLMEKVATYAFCSQSSMMFILTSLYGLKWSLRHGLNEETPSLSFTIIGLVLMHVLEDWETGRQCAETALTVLSKLQKQHRVAMTIFVAHTFVLCWTNPWRSRTRLFMEGYEKGMQVGDTEFATHNLGSYLFSLLVCGKNLSAVEEEFRIFVPLIETLKNYEQSGWVRIYWQTALNLIGKSDNTTILSGNAMD